MRIFECAVCNHKFATDDSVTRCINCSSLLTMNPKPCSGNMTEFKGANNIYYKEGCPALMSDGRFLTYYNSTNELTEEMRRVNGIRSTNEFRTFMQSNGDLFRNTERNYLISNNTCSPKTACSEGWFDLWTRKNGYWACDNHSFQ